MQTEQLPSEYLLLEQQRQHLLEKRKALERKHELRQRTLAELTTASSNATMQALAAVKKDNEAARTRNQLLLQDLTQLSHKFSGSDTTEGLLQAAKSNFVTRVERTYPLWEETALKVYQSRLEELENERRRVEYRRRINHEAYARRQAMENAVEELQGQLAIELTHEQEEELERQLSASARQHQVQMAKELLAREALHRTLETKNKFAQRLQEDESSLVHHFAERLQSEGSEQDLRSTRIPPFTPPYSRASTTIASTRSEASGTTSPNNSVNNSRASTEASTKARPPDMPAPISAARMAGGYAVPVIEHSHSRYASQATTSSPRQSRSATPDSPENSSRSPAISPGSQQSVGSPSQQDEASSLAASQLASGLAHTPSGASVPAIGESEAESEVSGDSGTGQLVSDASREARVSLSDVVKRAQDCARCLQDMFALIHQSEPDEFVKAYTSLQQSVPEENTELVQFVQAVHDKTIWNDESFEMDIGMVLTACCLLVQQFAQDLLPAELLTGVVTVQKIVKALKPRQPILAEIWSQLEQHLQLVATDAPAAVDAAVAVFVDVFMHHFLTRHSQQEQARLQRKVSSLLGSIVQPTGSTPKTASPTKSRPTTPTPQSPNQTGHLSGFQTPPPSSPDVGKKITNVSEPYMLSRSALGSQTQNTSGSILHHSNQRAGNQPNTSQYSEYIEDDEDDDSGFGPSGMSFLTGRGLTPIRHTPASSLARRAEESEEDDF